MSCRNDVEETVSKNTGDEIIPMMLYDGPLASTIEKHFPINPKRFLVTEHKFVSFPGYEKYHERFQNFNVRSSDIWIVTFPKTGTTWVQEMIWGIVNDINSKKSEEFLMQRSPFFEWDCFLPNDCSMLPQMEAGHPCAPGETWKLLQEIENPRIIKSHFCKELLPKKVWTEKPKIVSVIRDPRDVCVSFYYHTKKFDVYTGSFDLFVDLFLSNLSLFAPMWKIYLDFWNLRHDQNVLLLRYEELKEDLVSVIHRMSKFLERDLSEKYVGALCDHLSFDSMRNRSASNNEKIIQPTEEAQKIKFIRKGMVGDYKNHLSDDQLQRFKEWTEENLKDSDFPYYRDYN